MNASWHNDLADAPAMVDDTPSDKYKKAKYEQEYEQEYEKGSEAP